MLMTSLFAKDIINFLQHCCSLHDFTVIEMKCLIMSVDDVAVINGRYQMYFMRLFKTL